MEKAKCIDFFKKNWCYIAFAIILLIAIFTRTYKIDTILNGLHIDELGMGYDAFSIANYGVDRYLNQFPIYLINFGGGQSALYCYLAALVIKIIGVSTVSLRIPGITLSLLAIIAGFFLIKRTHGPKSALVFMSLMVVCPWHVMQSRFGLDCNLLSSMIIISITLLVVSKKWWQYVISGIAFGITLYTYALSYIIVPILLFLTLIYLLWIKRIKFRDIILLGIPIAILAIPLILMILVNMGYLPQIECGITIPKLLEFRVGEFSFHNIGQNLKLIGQVITADSFAYNSIPQFGTIYYFAIPLSILGAIIAIVQTVKSIKEKKFHISSIMVFLWIANIILMCLTAVNVNKINSIYIALLYFILIAIKWIYQKIKVGAVAILVVYAIMSILFFNYYYNQYEIDYPKIDLVNHDIIALTKRIEEIDKDKTVYLHLNIPQPWLYTAYSIQASPYEFYEAKRDENGEEWSNKCSLGRYYFELPDEIKGNSMYVINHDEGTIEFEQELKNQNYQVEQFEQYLIYY